MSGLSGEIPLLLTLLRLIIGPVLVVLAYTNGPRWIMASLVVTAFLSDVFDGIIARKLKVSTPFLRRFDSFADVCFYLAVALAGWILNSDDLRSFILPVAVLLILEILCQLICLAKFHQTTATHSYICKAWGILLFAAALALLGFGQTGIFMWAAIVFGYVAYLDVLLILALAKTPPVDVKSAYQIWQGKTTGDS
jgi:CDP-diacylglycerol--glycerol-3-phosphate 3-phosphatidyltransferase